jgi:acetate kinase
MGTRSGDVDPGLHAHLARQLGWSLERIDEVLNRGSGLLGLSGLTNDMRELEAAAERGHAGARLAIEVFCYRIAKSLAALSCALPRLDGIVFTGGIGENSPLVREVVSHLPHFGLGLDVPSMPRPCVDARDASTEAIRRPRPVGHPHRRGGPHRRRNPPAAGETTR